MKTLSRCAFIGWWVVILLLLSACSEKSTAGIETRTVAPSRTPFQPVAPTASLTPSVTPTAPVLLVTLDKSLPLALVKELQFPPSLEVVENGSELRLDVITGNQTGIGQQSVTWVYALVAPFPTIADGVSKEQLMAAWEGRSADGAPFTGKTLLLSSSTLAAFERIWGSPAPGAVEVLPADQLLDSAWAGSNWALVEFGDLEPRWKVLRVEGYSPLDKDFDAHSYLLTLNFGWYGGEAGVEQVENAMILPAGNRDPDKMAVVVMTGVTALTRATGWKMELNGMEYPAQDVLPWLKDADILHISNEVSFNPNCGPADPSQPNLMFCSAPEYIGLLDYIGADVIELSGNHNVDRGMDAFIYSLDLYRERGWGVYAGGMNLEEARKPLLMEYNGNRIAFLGCNLAGPERVWSTADTPGEAFCDYAYIDAQLQNLRKQGYLPIFTYQYYESYSPSASTPQKEDFRARALAGAVIVQGSQAHRPQGMDFAHGAFIHHGLGNLFFDQMEVTGVTGTRDEFIDRHVFYDGRYISTELLTALLEDYSRPKPTMGMQREILLEQMFSASGW